MNKYKVYITTGGVMEQPEHKIENVAIVDANDPDEAIEKWLVKFNLTDDSYIRRGSNGKGWSYYYSISCETVQINDDTVDSLFDKLRLEILSLDEQYGIEFSHRVRIETILEDIEKLLK